MILLFEDGQPKMTLDSCCFSWICCSFPMLFLLFFWGFGWALSFMFCMFFCLFLALSPFDGCLFGLGVITCFWHLIAVVFGRVCVSVSRLFLLLFLGFQIHTLWYMLYVSLSLFCIFSHKLLLGLWHFLMFLSLFCGFEQTLSFMFYMFSFCVCLALSPVKWLAVWHGCGHMFLVAALVHFVTALPCFWCCFDISIWNFFMFLMLFFLSSPCIFSFKWLTI